MKAIKEHRESDLGGMAHAAELETSVYLYLAPERVEMSKAVKDMNLPESDFVWLDLMQGSPVNAMDHWTRFSKSGVVGDATIATADKGEKYFEATVEAFLRLVKELKTRQRGERTDYHTEPWDKHFESLRKTGKP